MKKIFAVSLTILFLLVTVTPNVRAQSVELVAGNTLNGALQGTLLGGAAMGISGSDDFGALRVGVGLGTLYGLGMGAYDISQGGGRAIVVSGLFNDGNNSSIIVLLDTFYGAAVGSVVVTSVMLVANEPIVEGLRYGASIGAWAGFGFGLFDSFVLAKRSTAPSMAAYTPASTASGLLGVNFENGASLGFVNPTVIQTKSADLSSSLSPAVDVMNLRINF